MGAFDPATPLIKRIAVNENSHVHIAFATPIHETYWRADHRYVRPPPPYGGVRGILTFIKSNSPFIPGQITSFRALVVEVK